MKNYKYHYVYKTTNLINGKFYVGRHSSNKNPEKDNYLGSGKVLNKSLRKYGYKNFKREILEFCFDFGILCKQEEYWIEELQAVENGYNVTKVSKGFGIGESHPMFGVKRFGELNSNFGNKMSEEAKAKISKINKGKTPHNKGVPMKEEQKLKLSLFRKGKKASEETKRKISAKTKGKNNPRYGVVLSEEIKNNISKAKKKKFIINGSIKYKKVTCSYCGKTGGNNIMGRYHFDNCKFKL